MGEGLMSRPERPPRRPAHGRPRRRAGDDRGLSLIETMIAVGVMSICLIGTAQVLSQGVQRTNSSPGDLLATQKAQEAIESVFSARDSKVLTWAQVRNVAGATGSDGGIFLDAPQPLKKPGADGLVGTADDTTVEAVTFPGRDGQIGTADDEVRRMDGYLRQIEIRDIQPNLRSITVTVTFQSGSSRRSYTLTAYISNYA
jgi:type II secretory pathway pseudopilin PulG